MFNADEIMLSKELAGLLARCPNLRTLGLGLRCEVNIEFPQVVILEKRYLALMEMICLAYHATGEGPLHLRTLRMGHGICVKKSKVAEASNHLEKLFLIGKLEVLHMFNGWFELNVAGRPDGGFMHDLDLLKGCHCLRQVAVSQLGYDVRDWLNEEVPNLKELLLTGMFV